MHFAPVVPLQWHSRGGMKRWQNWPALGWPEVAAACSAAAVPAYPCARLLSFSTFPLPLSASHVCSACNACYCERYSGSGHRAALPSCRQSTSRTVDRVFWVWQPAAERAANMGKGEQTFRVSARRSRGNLECLDEVRVWQITVSPGPSLGVACSCRCRRLPLLLPAPLGCFKPFAFLPPPQLNAFFGCMAKFTDVEDKCVAERRALTNCATAAVSLGLSRRGRELACSCALPNAGFCFSSLHRCEDRLPRCSLDTAGTQRQGQQHAKLPLATHQPHDPAVTAHVLLWLVQAAPVHPPSSTRRHCSSSSSALVACQQSTSGALHVTPPCHECRVRAGRA